MTNLEIARSYQAAGVRTVLINNILVERGVPHQERRDVIEIIEPGYFARLRACTNPDN